MTSILTWGDGGRGGQLIPVARPTLDEEIEDIVFEENEEDYVMPITTFADILANAHLKKCQ